MSLYPFRCQLNDCAGRLEVQAPVGSDVYPPLCPIAEAAGEEHGRMKRDYSSVRMAPSATPTRRGGTAVIEATEREAKWAKDLPAYKRLRQQGLQPASTEGAAMMEAGANTRVEVEHGIDSPMAQAERAGVLGDVQAALGREVKV